MRSKCDKFKQALEGYSQQRKIEFDLPYATTKELNDIRKRLKEEQKYRMFKVVILTILLFLGLVFILCYLAKDNRSTFWF